MIKITVWLALTCAGFLTSQAMAETPTTHNGITVNAQGKLVQINATRRAQLVAQLRASLAASGTPASSGPIRTLPNGTQAMKLGAEHTAFIVAATNADDSLDVRCVLGAQAAADVIAASEDQ